MIDQISKQVADYLGLDELPIQFGKIDDDSILITKNTPKIIINEKYKDNYIECAKSITYEYRHSFQIMMIALMLEEPLSKVWEEELKTAVTSGNAGYEE